MNIFSFKLPFSIFFYYIKSNISLKLIHCGNLFLFILNAYLLLGQLKVEYPTCKRPSRVTVNSLCGTSSILYFAYSECSSSFPVENSPLVHSLWLSFHRLRYFCIYYSTRTFSNIDNNYYMIAPLLFPTIIISLFHCSHCFVCFKKINRIMWSWNCAL